jgi:hypothetical protein
MATWDYGTAINGLHALKLAAFPEKPSALLGVCQLPLPGSSATRGAETSSAVNSAGSPFPVGHPFVMLCI